MKDFLTEDRIKECANVCIDVFGKKIKANRKIVTKDDEGKTHIAKEEIILERVYQDYGFELAYLEDTDAYLCIFFNDELVFNTVGDAYKEDDYDSSSPTLLKLFNEFDEPSANCFIHGEWEELLEYIADNAEAIKVAKKIMAEETKKFLEIIARKNDLMVKHIPFRNFAGRRYFEDSVVHIENHDGAITVYSIEEERHFLMIRRNLKDCVFCFSESFYQPGTWEKHVERLIDTNIDKIRNNCEDCGIDPVTLRYKKDIEAEEQAKIKPERKKQYKSAGDYIKEISKII